MIEAVMESKLLDLNKDKSCYILIGQKKFGLKLKAELEAQPLSLCSLPMKEKVSDKYLGDYIHSEGIKASVFCTISNRSGRISSSIIETRAIIDDCRINAVGGLLAGLDIWELAILPALLNNCQTWTNICEKSLKMLEDLQNTMYRTLMNVPITCPTPSLCWDLGGIQMKFRINQKKLEFLWHLINLEDGALAKEILFAQKQQKLPGLVQECEILMEKLHLPNVFEEIMSKQQWKNEVKKAIMKENELDLRSKMFKYEKLKKSELVSEDFGIKPYIKHLSVHDARAIYKKRTSMMQYVKMNYMNDMKYVKTLWLCNSCQTSIDNMDHVLWCKSYRQLRQGKNLENDKDLAQYLHDVLKIRSNLEIDK